MDGTDQYTLDTLRTEITRSGTDPEAVVECWSAERSDGQSLAEYLTQCGILRSGAVATLRSMQRGYAMLDPVALLESGVETRFQQFATLHLDMIVPLGVRPCDSPMETAVMDIPAATETLQYRRTRPRIGDTVGRCVLTRLIGSGGGGSVYEALHTGLAITVAVKMLNETNITQSVRRALRDEARLLARLNHPHAVRVYDYCDDGDVPFLVMELVSGSSLADLLSQCGYVAAARAAGIVAQSARGLAAAHALGIVHRDVKPANLLVTRSGQVKIADLGLACLKGTDGWAKHGGTVAYMAPERFGDAATADERSDLYALGVTLYECLTGRPPFQGGTAMELMIQHVEDDPIDPRRFNPLIPESLVRTCARLMAKWPQDRHASYGELLDDLAGFFRSLPEAEAMTEWNPFIPSNFDSSGYYSTGTLSSRSY